uniref:Lipoprotein n=1 Tax=uncultured Thiotrichaceae bacterium TaxID=298394 RepID=A0A6S6UBI1_9GAMM|nr:MAG: Unknown protein [uncultured Thiotrichaceae bacterium]
MKMKTQLTLAAVVAAGLLASGCSQQMVGQQVAQQVAPAAAAPVKTIVDCSKCKKPAAPRRGNMHAHPAIPNCTDSIKHNHPHPQGGRHSHKYGCKKAPRRAAPPRKAPVARPAPVQRVDPNAHTHPAIPNCTDSIRHVHPNGSSAHAHRYSCRKPVQRQQVRVPRPAVKKYQQVVPVMPKVKAKGTYRGPIKIDGVMQQYQN